MSDQNVSPNKIKLPQPVFKPPASDLAPPDPAPVVTQASVSHASFMPPSPPQQIQKKRRIFRRRAKYKKPPTSLPIISLIFGIGGFFFYFFYSVPAIIFGIWGYFKAKRLQQSTRTAKAGITLGILSTIMWVWITYNIMSP